MKGQQLAETHAEPTGRAPWFAVFALLVEELMQDIVALLGSCLICTRENGSHTEVYSTSVIYTQ